MLKIGILTYHRSINYGAVLQAISLKDALSNIYDAKVNIIDVSYKKPYARDRPIASWLRPARIPLRIIQNRKFNDFLNQNGSLTQGFLLTDNTLEMREYIKRQGFDFLVVGSDEVWKFNNLRPHENIYWLNSVGECQKMSYAASANGTRFHEITDSQRALIRKALEDFKLISVRDETTYKFLRECGVDKEIIISNDPALLFDLKKYHDGGIVARYKRYFQKKSQGKKVMGVMVRSRLVLQQLYKKYKNEYYVVSIMGNSINSHKNYRTLSPIEWINMFECFDFIVTNYFHGVILSILHKKPFIVVDAKEEYRRYKSKNSYLTSSNGFEDYYFYLHDKDFSWGKVFLRIAELDEFPTGHEIKMINNAKQEFEKYLVTFRDRNINE